MPRAAEGELVFVVDVSSFTKKGFIASTTFGGSPVDIEFDDGDEGITLRAEMARRIHVRKGSPVSVLVEDDKTQVTGSTVASIGKVLRISDSKVYYAVGREGGAIVRIRRP